MPEVNKEMIVLARDAHGWSQEELAKRIGVSQGKVSKYENGMLAVSDEDLAAICRETHYNEDFFRLHEPIYGLGSSFIFNRKRKSAPVAIQRIVQAKVNVARLQLSRLLRSTEVDAAYSIQPIDVQSTNGDAAEVARRFRAAWRIPLGPIRSVTRVIEGAGGFVVPCRFGTNLIDAAHLWVPGNPPMFFMNNNISGDRHRFNLAHELGHAVMHQFPVGDIEAEANAFAAEFLMPAAEIAPELSDLNLEKLGRLKQRWRVSMSSLIYRAKEVGRIAESKASSLYALLGKMGYRQVEPINIEVEQPSLIPQLIDLHKKSFGYADSELMRLLFVDTPEQVEITDKMNHVRRALKLDSEPLPFTPPTRKQA